MDPAPKPVPVRARLAVLARELVTVRGVERAPGTDGVKLDVSRQSVVVSVLVKQLGVPNDHSVEANASPPGLATVSPAVK